MDRLLTRLSPQDEVANATGAGDTFVGALVHHMVSNEMEVDTAVTFAMKAAAESIKFAGGAVSPDLAKLL